MHKILSIALALFATLGWQALIAQNWQYENVLDEVREGGQTADLVVDPQGTLHAAWHNSLTDQLIYAQRPAGASAWTKETVDPGRKGGFEPEVKIDANGDVHLAYFGNLSGLQPRYAFRNGPDDWTVENVIDSAVGTFGQFGKIDSVRIQASITLDVTDPAAPEVYYFDGYFKAVWRALALELERAVRKVGILGLHKRLATAPKSQLNLGWVACESKFNNARYGEFCNAFRLNNGRRFVLANNRTNGRLVAYHQFQSGLAPIFWSEETLDYNDHIHKGEIGNPNTIQFQDFFAKFTYEGISGQLLNDTLHVSYAMSDNYGRNIGMSSTTNSDILVNNVMTVMYCRVRPNLTTDTIVFLGPDNSTLPVGDYRSYTDIAVLNTDTIFISVANLSRDEFELWTTYDAGESWSSESFAFDNLDKQMAPIAIAGDSLHMMAFDAGPRSLYHIRKHVADGPGNHTMTQINRTERLAERLDADVSRPAPSAADELHVAFDGYNQRALFYGHKANGNWRFDTLATGLRTDAAAVSANSAGDVAVLYDTQDTIKVALKSGGNWSTGSLNTNVIALWQDIQYSPGGDTLHVLYYDLLFSQLIYRQGDGQTWWVNEIINTGGDGLQNGDKAAMVIDAANRPHVVYTSMEANLEGGDEYSIRYARRTGANAWNKLIVATDTTAQTLVQTDIMLDSLQRPYIAVANNRTSNPIQMNGYQYIDDTTWVASDVATPYGGAAMAPIDLESDSLGRPWLMYTRTSLIDEPQLAHYYVEDEGWNDFFVGNNLPNGRIQSIADFMTSGRRLYIIGKETNMDNAGLGLLTLEDWPTEVDSFVSGTNTLLVNDNSLKVYPNPVQSQLNLELSEPLG